MNAISFADQIKLSDCLAELSYQGVRRLLVLQGEQAWCYQMLSLLQQQIAGDWLTLSSSLDDALPFDKAKTLLGQEFVHGVFDATESLSLDALAILAGTLKAGSFLVLLMQPEQSWVLMPDQDSLRWCESDTPIATPHFRRYFCQCLNADPTIIVWQQTTERIVDRSPTRELFAKREIGWQLSKKQPEQQQLLSRLLQTKQGVYLLTAKRGRGKSSLAGMFAAQKQCCITAPNRNAIKNIYQFTTEKQSPFYAPDDLLARCEKGEQLTDWLVIDEAAAIPIAILVKLIRFFPAVLLTTTVQGYEGTGLGIIHKIKEFIPEIVLLTLSAPIRWNENDPLEKWLDQLMLLIPNPLNPIAKITAQPVIHYTLLNRLSVAEQTVVALLADCYQLLTAAHYKTTLIDLRRLFDAPEIDVITAKQNNILLGTTVLVKEGGLEPELIELIWQGRRRPKGNLVAQALAYSGEKEAAYLHSIRINRIAVKQQYRRQKIAQTMLEHAIVYANSLRCDYLSVSFAYSESLYHFWQQCGFYLVNISYYQETSSGSYSVMMIRPLTNQGDALLNRIINKLRCHYIYIEEKLPLAYLIKRAYLIGNQKLPCRESNEINSDTVSLLVGFAYHYRSIEASYVALIHFLKHINIPCLALRAYLEKGISPQQLINELNLTGQKMLLQYWRDEIKFALKEAGLL